MKDMGSFLGQLLIRSFDRSTRVYNAMQCRGFAGVYHSGPKKRLSLSDLVFLAVTLPLLLAGRFFSLSAFFGGLFSW
jgi:cobalt/nickel transport system permease protein